MNYILLTKQGVIMSDKRYSGSIALSKLKNVQREMKGKDGKMQKVIIIPIAANHLTEGKEGAVYMAVSVLTKEEQDKYKQNGFISQQVDSKVYKSASDEEKEAFKDLPILGNIKDFSQGSGDSAAASGAVGEDFETPMNHELPF